VFAQKKLTAADYKKSFGTPLGKASWGYVALMGIIALFIPTDILNYPWAVAFSDFMAGWVPQIDRFSGLGIQPEVNRFYYSVLWAMSPGVLVLSVFKIWEDLKMGYGASSMPLLKLLPLVALICVVIYASQYGYWMTNTSNGVLRFILGNRLGRAFWGNIMYVAGPTMFIGALLGLAYGWFSGYIPENIRRQAEEGGQ
jgi:hypothetical protein